MKTAQPAAASPTDCREIAQQLEVELALLISMEQAIRNALQCMTRDRGNVRKLSTLRFVSRSFERHLTRVRILADHGGYMHLIIEAKPHLASEAEALKETRRELQAAFEGIMLRLEYVSPDDTVSFEQACTDLDRYLGRLRLHGQKEMEFVQHSFAQEEGGSG